MKTTVGLAAIVAVLALTVPTTWSQKDRPIGPDRKGELPVSCKPAVQRLRSGVRSCTPSGYLESAKAFRP